MERSESENNFRKGFLIGIGLIIPLSVTLAMGEYFSYLISSSLYVEEEGYSSEHHEWFADFTQNVTIESFHDVKRDDQVHVLGTLINSGDRTLGSIRLEAEFFDASGAFVYEESKYLNMKIAPGEKENFMIKCGCNKQGFPEYASVTVRVTSASLR